MSTTKTVNVTTGKVLQYTITKEGYKPIHGSKLVTSSETINITMSPTVSQNGVYQFGDRIGGIATFFCYFDSINKENNVPQRYACFVLDAAYRTTRSNWNIDNWSNLNPPFPLTTGFATLNDALNCKDSATWNTQQILDTYNPGNTGRFNAFYNARSPNGTPLFIEVGGATYAPQLPNIYELNQIHALRTRLDPLDPTLADYPNKDLSNFGFAYSSYYRNVYVPSSTVGYRFDFYCGITGNQNNPHVQYDVAMNLPDAGVCPIFEIPVE